MWFWASGISSHYQLCVLGGISNYAAFECASRADSGLILTSSGMLSGTQSAWGQSRLVVAIRKTYSKFMHDRSRNVKPIAQFLAFTVS